ncbi:unnamed protein product [Rotaria sp. Silwood2]|nr:unnamed protein product [Rotaria sp. Silwood2]CAF4000381.1 unnamed protein product [Rotaria sp. Silwood2]
MLRVRENFAQVRFYQNNNGHIFIKLNDGTMIDVPGTTGTKRHHHHHHHSSKTNKTAAARAAAMVNHETGKL